MKIVTCTAPVNIALIKYWGKRDEKLILPLNDSISFTLNQDDMCAKTTISASPSYSKDRFWLNGKEESLDNPRIKNCLQEIRRRITERKLDGNALDLLNCHVHICSENNFPTAAGLASSAAGYACLVYTLAQLYDLEGDLSTISRQGSGSACRSMYGGMVRWLKGRLDDGSDSMAKQVLPSDKWKDIHAIICVVSDDRKKTSSTSGMQQSVETSSLLQHRINDVVNTNINLLLEAANDNNWSEVCDVTMRDSNQMHAVCLDTSPPCVYMNDTSHAIVQFVHAYNTLKTRKKDYSSKVCYTFDAGPNACIFVPSKSLSEFVTLITKVFPATEDMSKDYIKGKTIKMVPIEKDLLELISSHENAPGRLKYLIHTTVGEGPRLISKDVDDQKSHLLDIKTGLPLS